MPGLPARRRIARLAVATVAAAALPAALFAPAAKLIRDAGVKVDK